MLSLYIAPRNYVTGYDIMEKIGEHVKKIAKSLLVVSDVTVYSLLKEAFISFDKNGIKYTKEYFNGECSHSEIDRLKFLIEEGEYDAVIGFGGGKIMDTVKAAGYKAKVKIITVPTNAATCAAWSSHSAVYTDDGIAYEYFDIYKNADLLFMDKKVVAQAPVRYTVAGIADTLAKWIETEVSSRDIKNKNIETEIAVYLAKKCYDDCINYGRKAVADIKNGQYSDEVDKILESIIITAGLVGGIGGESCRSVAAHAVNNGFTVLPKLYSKNLHGEVVGFGNIVQMVLDKKSDEEIESLIKFYISTGIPCSLEEFGYDKITDEQLDKIANRSIFSKDTMGNLPYTVTHAMVKDAIREADSIVSKMKKRVAAFRMF